MTSEKPPDAPATDEKPAEKKPPSNAVLWVFLLPVMIVVAIIINANKDDDSSPRDCEPLAQWNLRVGHALTVAQKLSH